MTILALFAMLLLVVTLAADKARALANEVRWRWCRFWYTQVKWRLGK